MSFDEGKDKTIENFSSVMNESSDNLKSSTAIPTHLIRPTCETQFGSHISIWFNSLYLVFEVWAWCFCEGLNYINFNNLLSFCSYEDSYSCRVSSLQKCMMWILQGTY